MTEELYRNIEAERARKGLTISELAELLLINDKTLRNWKHNKKPLNNTTIIRLCEIFNCSSDYLLGMSSNIKQQTKS